MTIRVLTVGLGTGFIVFFALRGSEHLFFVDGRSAFNPYGTAFFGLLAGLFTSRAYAILEQLIEHALKQTQEIIEQRLNANSNMQGQQEGNEQQVYPPLRESEDDEPGTNERLSGQS